MSPSAREVLRQQVRVAEWMTKQRLARLVEVLPIYEDNDLGCGVCREPLNCCVGHLVSKADQDDKKAPVIQLGSRGP
jgi:hypothetical protein